MPQEGLKETSLLVGEVFYCSGQYTLLFPSFFLISRFAEFDKFQEGKSGAF
nr:MAG TPA_asm: hypothetical protein [Caudoviricetes sp.]